MEKKLLPGEVVRLSHASFQDLLATPGEYALRVQALKKPPTPENTLYFKILQKLHLSVFPPLVPLGEKDKDKDKSKSTSTTKASEYCVRFHVRQPSLPLICFLLDSWTRFAMFGKTLKPTPQELSHKYMGDGLLIPRPLPATAATSGKGSSDGFDGDDEDETDVWTPETDGYVYVPDDERAIAKAKLKARESSGRESYHSFLNDEFRKLQSMALTPEARYRLASTLQKEKMCNALYKDSKIPIEEIRNRKWRVCIESSTYKHEFLCPDTPEQVRGMQSLSPDQLQWFSTVCATSKVSMYPSPDNSDWSTSDEYCLRLQIFGVPPDFLLPLCSYLVHSVRRWTSGQVSPEEHKRASMFVPLLQTQINLREALGAVDPSPERLAVELKKKAKMSERGQPVEEDSRKVIEQEMRELASKEDKEVNGVGVEEFGEDGEEEGEEEHGQRGTRDSGEKSKDEESDESEDDEDDDTENRSLSPDRKLASAPTLPMPSSSLPSLPPFTTPMTQTQTSGQGRLLPHQPQMGPSPLLLPPSPALQQFRPPAPVPPMFATAPPSSSRPSAFDAYTAFGSTSGGDSTDLGSLFRSVR